jgi:hypothetical protein
MFPRLRLNQHHKRLAVQVSRDAFAACEGDKDKFKALAKADARVVGLDPATIALLIQLAIAIFQYFMNRKAAVTGADAEDDDTVILQSLRYTEK